jgi:protein-tyrosine phosphatase
VSTHNGLNMIDLCSHILDETVCGPASFAESVEMCRAAVADGVRTIVATPCWAADSTEPPLSFADCRRKIERLQTELRGALSLRLGFVLPFSPQLPAIVERYGSQLALGGKRHLLVSLPALRVPDEAEDVWQSLGRQGFSIVVAHPECSAVLRRDPERIGRWVASGVTLQIDAASVSGAHGREVRGFAIDCLRQYEGRAVVASNAHGTNARQPLLGKAREELIKQIGARPTIRFLRETPTAIISDKAQPSKQQRAPSGLLSSLFRAIRPSKALTGEF